jgi:tRNA(His) 5'-end guanylyltransferase
MSQCGSHDCYEFGAVPADFYDFDLSFSEFLSGETICAIVCGTLFLMYVSYISSCLRNGYKSSYLKDFEETKESEDEYGREYERYEWPYYSSLKVPYDLEDRMKFWEKLSQQITKVDPTYPFIVRIDGCNFSKFTQKLKALSKDEVFSNEFRGAMVDTACDLLLKFKPITVYTHSDEITLVFQDYVSYDDDDNEIVTGEHYRSGKVYKLLSEIPSCASTMFTRNLRNKFSEKHDVLEYLSGVDLSFDARLIVFPREATYEVANHMIWRTRDCYRNYVSAYAEKYVGKPKLNKVSTDDRVALLKEQNVDLTDETKLDFSHLGMKYGLFLKKYESSKDNDLIQAFYSSKLQFSDELVDFMLFSLKVLEYDNDDEENTSVVEKDIEVKSPKSFAMDSYEFEDVFNGTATLQKQKRNK